MSKTTTTRVPKKSTPKKPSLLQRYIADGRARADRYLAARPHRSFIVTPAYKYKRGKKMASVWRLIKGSFGTMWREKKLLLPVLILFAVITYVVVGGVSQLAFLDVRQAAQNLFSGNWGAFGTVSTLFTAAVTGSLNPSVSQLQQLLGGILVFLFWLVLVWILRRRLAGEPTSIREALYNSGGPIIATIVVAVALVFQLLPGALGVIGATLTLTGAWFHGGVESMVICAAAVLLCVLSFYWFASTFTALIIVTLPGMYPWRALSAASDLVVGQRWRLLVRLFFLLVTLLLVWAMVLIPILLLDGWLKFSWLPLVPIVAQLLTAFTLVYSATFVYKMYKSML